MSAGDRVRHRNLPEYGWGEITAYIGDYHGIACYQVEWQHVATNLYSEDVLILDPLETLAQI